MGFMNNAYTAYKNTGIKTASQGKLVVLLYEGAIKNLTNALECFDSDSKIEAKNIEKFGNYIMKAQDIISELQASLNMSAGGEIASNLMSLYIYFNRELMSSNINKDKKKIEFVLNMLNQLSAAWVQAANSQSNAVNTGFGGGLNIEGEFMELTQAQIDERIAVLKRFRTLLEQQRNKFREYLHVLECQQNKIEEEDGDALVAHAELEQQIVSNISNLQKVIEPMQSMYNAVSHGTELGAEDKISVKKMQAELADLQKKVLAQNARNQDLLKEHIESVKKQLAEIHNANPYFGKRSVYSTTAAVTGNFVAEA